MKRPTKHSYANGTRISSLCAAAGSAVSVDGLLGAERGGEASVFTSASASASKLEVDRRLAADVVQALRQGREDLRCAVLEVTVLHATLTEEVRDLNRRHTLTATLQAENARLRDDLARRDTLAPLIRDLIAVVDAASRLIEESGDQAGASPAAALLGGIRAIQCRVLHALDRYGVRSGDVAVGDPFDPGLHDIDTTVSAKEPNDVGRIARVYRGLFVESRGRTVRPALVSVFARP